jgi:hypothetical protein
MMEMANDERHAGCREGVRFSCIYKSARKQIVKSALSITLAGGRGANKYVVECAFGADADLGQIVKFVDAEPVTSRCASRQLWRRT